MYAWKMRSCHSRTLQPCSWISSPGRSTTELNRHDRLRIVMSTLGLSSFPLMTTPAFEAICKHTIDKFEVVLTLYEAVSAARLRYAARACGGEGRKPKAYA